MCLKSGKMKIAVWICAAKSCFRGTELVPVIDSSSARLVAGRKGSDKSDIHEGTRMSQHLIPEHFFHLHFLPKFWPVTNGLL